MVKRGIIALARALRTKFDGAVAETGIVN